MASRTGAIREQFQTDQVHGPYFRQLCDRMVHLADKDRSVLVYGGTGAGKEILLRRYCQRMSERGKQTEIINCGAMQPELLDSELFGHVRGAFTGAAGRRQGLIESYDCLALDEIGDASPEFQVRLLRAMEHGEYRPLGSDQFKTKDVTFIAATNNIWALRRDLLNRFEVRIEIPSLWLRRHDLIEIFFYLARQEGVSAVTERCATFVLSDYGWPGNVREIKYALTEAADRTDGGPLDLRHLPMSVPAPHNNEVPVWQLDSTFVDRAAKRFVREDEEILRSGMPKRTYGALWESEPAPWETDAWFRRQINGALSTLAQTAQTIEHRFDEGLEHRILTAASPDEAARLASKIWFDQRLRDGLTRKQIAQLIGRTEQAVGKQFRKLGIIHSRKNTKQN